MATVSNVIDLEALEEQDGYDQPQLHDDVEDRTWSFIVDLSKTGPEIVFSKLVQQLEGNTGMNNSSIVQEKDQNMMDQDESDGADSNNSYYDIQDPFIDDSSAYDPLNQISVQPTVSGFFAQDGSTELEVKVSEKNEAGSQKKKKRKRTPEDVENFEYSERMNELLDDVLKKKAEIDEKGLRLSRDELFDVMADVLTPCQRLISLEVGRFNRTTVYMDISHRLGGVSHNMLRPFMRLSYDRWKLAYLKILVDRSLDRLRVKIEADVKRHKDAVAPLPDLDESKSKYRCKWESIADDLVLSLNYTKIYVELFNQIEARASKSNDDALTQISENKEKSCLLSKIMEFWPEGYVQRNQVSVAWRRYKDKFWKTLKEVESDIENDPDFVDWKPSGPLEISESRQVKKRKKNANSTKIQSSKSPTEVKPPSEIKPPSEVKKSQSNHTFEGLQEAAVKTLTNVPMSTVFYDLPENAFSTEYYVEIEPIAPQ